MTFLSVLLVTIWPATAPLGDPTTTADSARALFELAEEHYREKRYVEAQRAYAEAYEKSGKAALLFNIGQCHLAMGDYQRAAFFYEQYLHDAPDSPHVELVRARLEEALALESQRNLPDPGPARPAPQDTAPPLASPQAPAPSGPPVPLWKAKPSAPLAAAPLAPQRPLEPMAFEPPPPIYERWWFWTAIGAVAIGGAVAVAIAATDPFAGTPTIGGLQRR